VPREGPDKQVTKKTRWCRNVPRQASNLGAIFVSKFDKKNHQKKHNKKNKIINYQETFWQNGANIDAETHPKSMQKMVPTKIRKSIEDHDFLKCKNMEIHCKGHHF
jgi:hypothetical protein